MNFPIVSNKDVCFQSTQEQLQVLRYKLKMVSRWDHFSHSQGGFRATALQRLMTRESSQVHVYLHLGNAVKGYF